MLVHGKTRNFLLLKVNSMSHVFGDLLETFSHAEQPELRHKSCNCYEMSSDIEGVKLDVTILDAKLQQHSNLISQMQDKLTKQCSKLDSTQFKRHDIPVSRDIHDDVQVIHADLNLQQQQSISSTGYLKKHETQIQQGVTHHMLNLTI